MQCRTPNRQVRVQGHELSLGRDLRPTLPPRSTWHVLLRTPNRRRGSSLWLQDIGWCVGAAPPPPRPAAYFPAVSSDVTKGGDGSSARTQFGLYL